MHFVPLWLFLLVFRPAPSRFNEFKQMVDLGFGPGPAEFPTNLFGEIAVNVCNDIERLPPAINYLETRLPVFFTGSAVFEENRPTQPGTAPLSCIVFGIHYCINYRLFITRGFG